VARVTAAASGVLRQKRGRVEIKRWNAIKEGGEERRRGKEVNKTSIHSADRACHLTQARPASQPLTLKSGRALTEIFAFPPLRLHVSLLRKPGLGGRIRA